MAPPTTKSETSAKFITKSPADLIFQACISFVRSFRTSGTSIREILFLVLPFLVFFFCWKMARKTTKKTRIFYPYWTPKTPGKEGKNAQKNKEFLAGPKNKEFLAGPKNKEFQKTRKGRTGLYTGECYTLEGPTRKPRHASVFSTHSDTQAVPAFHCEYEYLNALFRHALF